MSIFAVPTVDEWGGTTYSLTAAGYTALVVVMLACLLLGCALFGGNKKFSAKQLAFSAMAIALATVASMIKLIHLPMGGSVTLLSMFFVTLIGYWYGLGAGLTTGVAYGILQLVIDPYIISVPQMLVDYVFAFGALGLAGLLWKNKKKYGIILCYIAGILGRYIFAVISGWIFFGMYASDYGFSSPVVYSLAYNGAYIFLEAGITIVILLIPPVNKALSYVKEIATK